MWKSKIYSISQRRGRVKGASDEDKYATDYQMLPVPREKLLVSKAKGKYPSTTHTW